MYRKCRQMAVDVIVRILITFSTFSSQYKCMDYPWTSILMDGSAYLTSYICGWDLDDLKTLYLTSKVCFIPYSLQLDKLWPLSANCMKIGSRIASFRALPTKKTVINFNDLFKSYRSLFSVIFWNLKSDVKTCLQTPSSKLLRVIPQFTTKLYNLHH